MKQFVLPQEEVWLWEWEEPWLTVLFQIKSWQFQASMGQSDALIHSLQHVQLWDALTNAMQMEFVSMVDAFVTLTIKEPIAHKSVLLDSPPEPPPS